MADDFAKTAEQMMFDARALRDGGAHRNACYLSGYVVECTLKTLLDKAGPAPAHTHDLESLHAAVAQLLLDGSPLAARYGDPASLAPTMLQQIKPPKKTRNGIRYFCHWDPEHRYDGSRWGAAPMSQSYLNEANNCLDVIVRMLMDGVL